jgi:hypothetical protein
MAQSFDDGHQQFTEQRLQWLTNKLEECEREYVVADNNVYVLMLAIG